MPTVFISYSHQDIHIAEEIEDVLSKQGFDIWRDRTGLRAGGKWSLEIDRAIEDSFALLLICTDDAKKSPHVAYEWGYARGLRFVTIIPIYFTNIVEEVPTQLLEAEALKYGEGAFWGKLIKTLQALRSADSLSNIHIPREADKYLRDLAQIAYFNTNIEESKKAIETLSTHDGAIARELLINGLNHPQSKIRGSVIESMSNTWFQDERAIPKLMELLEVSHPKQDIAGILVRLGKPGIEAVIEVIPLVDVMYLRGLMVGLTNRSFQEDADYVVTRLVDTLGYLPEPSLIGIIKSINERHLQPHFKVALQTKIVPFLEQMLNHADWKYGPHSDTELQKAIIEYLESSDAPSAKGVLGTRANRIASSIE